MKKEAWDDPLEDIIQALAEGIIIIDRGGRITFVNSSTERITGLSRSELVGHFYRDVALTLMMTTLDGRPLSYENLSSTQALETGNPIYGRELLLTRPDGAKITISVNAIPLCRAGKMISGVVVSFTDITQRKHAEEAIRASEANYRAIFNAANDAIFVHDLNTGNILDANRKATGMYGYTTEEMMHLNIVDLSAGTPPYSQEDAIRWVEKTAVEGPQLFEWMAKDKSGRLFWVEVNLKRATIGREKRILAVVRDISERKRLEEERMQLSKRVQLLLESTDEGIYGLDLEGHTTIFNKAASLMTGYAPDEALGKNIHELIHYKHADGSPYPVEDCPVFRAFRAGQGVRIDTEVFWKKDGTPFPVEYSSYPIVEGGVIRGAVVTFTDITGRKRAEALSNALNNINSAINSTLDFDEIMQRVVVDSAKALRADVAGIALREDDRWVARYLCGTAESQAGIRLSQEEVEYITRVIKEKKPVAISDAYNDERFSPELARKHGVKSILAIPLLAKNEPVGVLIFIYRRTTMVFTNAQIDFANKLAVSVSLAIENARLYAAERNIADTLQEALLTVPKHIEGIDFGYLYRSATVTAKVGGDFYDLFELEHERVGIVVGDVSGKGLEAATLTSLVKTTIKVYAYEGFSPASVMAKTNDLVNRISGSRVFITIFFGILDTRTGILVYCSAGHPPAILKRHLGETLFLITSSPVIGVFHGLNYIDDQVAIERGDMVVLYTDGVTEARCDSGFFGDTRLALFMKNLAPMPVKQVPGAIFNEILRCTGGRLSDDIALLAISY